MRWFRLTAIAVCLPGVAYAAWAMTTGLQGEFHSHGKIQSGHSDLDCTDCHQPSRGTLRQQLQANTRYLLNLRTAPVDFGFKAVDSSNCIECHERPNDRHPIFRFREPRFKESRTLVEATSCLGCHSEHNDTKVSIGTEFCYACHEDLEMKNDPVDIPHVELIADENWGSCLGCHDFHGNHKMETSIVYADRIPVTAIKNYFGNGPSPYGDILHYGAIEK